MPLDPAAAPVRVVLLPLLTAAVLSAAALSASQDVALGARDEAYAHVPGHLVSATVAAVVAGSTWTLARGAAAPAARRAALALAAAWALLAVVRLVEAAGGAVTGSGESALHDVGVVALGPAVVLVLVAHAALVLVPSGQVPRLLRLALVLTVPGWLGVEDAGSGRSLLLGLAAAAVWVLVAAWARAGAGSRPSDVPASWGCVLAGLLWVPYGALELLQPFGPDVRYDEAAGYDVVVDPALFVAYSLPGSLALVLSGLGLVGLARRGAAPGAGARRAGAVTAGLGALGLVGVLLRLDPVFTSSRALGTLVLGAGLLAAARRARADRYLLGAVGLLALSLLPLWPAVYAVQWVPASVGAGLFVGLGAGWVLLGAGPPATARTRAGSPPARGGTGAGLQGLADHGVP